MKHFISLSGGTASAVAANRVLTRYGLDDTILWFADTRWEDEDLYRFLIDLEAYWGKTIVRFTEGRTPLEVASDKSIIPNNKIAPCSFTLKIEPAIEYVTKLAEDGLVTVHLGLDWMEQHRAAKPRQSYEGIGGVTLDLPLMWKPIANPPHRKVTESWGIKTPRLYDLGFPHNNCGGRCVRQGIAEWTRLKHAFPERFDGVKEWEQAQRAKGGPRAKYSIAKDQKGKRVVALTLEDLEKRYAGGQQLFLGSEPSQEDNIGCMCW